MPFHATTLKFLEDVLSEGFGLMGYHSELDNFILRAGVSQAFLSEARIKAGERATKSAKGFTSPSKRFVTQELLNLLTQEGGIGDQAVAGLITHVVKGNFPEATDKAKSALADLKNQIEEDKREKENQKRKLEEEKKAQEILEKERSQEDHRRLWMQEKEKLKNEFLNLTCEEDHQKRGYQFERFLNAFFKHEGLSPRSPFRNKGEQIDGSFIWRNQTHLIEAKWVKSKVGASEFSSLMYKIEGKTADTRGLFISVNGYSSEAINSLSTKGSLRFVCIDGAHIMRCLVSGEGLKDILERVWRNADETGEPYLTVADFQK